MNKTNLREDGNVVGFRSMAEYFNGQQMARCCDDQFFLLLNQIKSNKTFKKTKKKIVISNHIIKWHKF
jgi:hypothetical protein